MVDILMFAVSKKEPQKINSLKLLGKDMVLELKGN